MIDDARLDELLALAAKATPGPWRWQDAYEFHDDHVSLGLDADCENVRDEYKRMVLKSTESTVLRQWSDCAGDAGVAMETTDARLIEACDPDTIRELVQEVRDWRASSGYLAPPVAEFQSEEKRHR